jgi:hypothetical protein
MLGLGQDIGFIHDQVKRISIERVETFQEVGDKRCLLRLVINLRQIKNHRKALGNDQFGNRRARCWVQW